MRNLKIISALLDYPEPELLESRRELVNELKADPFLAAENRAALIEFTDQLCTSDLLDIQENYVGLFDRGRSTSLLLFEHVHGESRDRGQAMVDLMAVYQRSGFIIDQRELPDYLPLFLEFLSRQPEAEVRQWVADVCHILSLLEARLHKRESPYAVLFEALLSLIDVRVEREAIKQKVASELPDDTPEALDQVWEEEMVRFSEGTATQCAESNVLKQRRETLSSAQPLSIQPTGQRPLSGLSGS